MASLRSPRYVFEIPASAIPAGGVYLIELANDEAYAENAPYNTILIRNFSGQRLDIKYGDTRYLMGPSEILNDDKAYGTNRVIIANLDTLTANDDIIYVMVSRVVSSDDCIIATTTGENIYTVSNGGV